MGPDWLRLFFIQRRHPDGALPFLCCVLKQSTVSKEGEQTLLSQQHKRLRVQLQHLPNVPLFANDIFLILGYVDSSFVALYKNVLFRKESYIITTNIIQEENVHVYIQYKGPVCHLEFKPLLLLPIKSLLHVLLNQSFNSPLGKFSIVFLLCYFCEAFSR